MEKITKIETPEVAIPRKGISQAVRFGSTIFVSGQVGEDAQGNIPQGIEAQVELAIENAAGFFAPQALIWTRCSCADAFSKNRRTLPV